MIEINIQTEQSVTVVIPKGRIDTTTSSDLDQMLRPLIEKEKYLILDLSQCNFLSSAGIRILLVSAKKCLAGGGGLFLAGLLPEVFQVLEMAGLHQIFRIFKSTEEAQTEIERIRILSEGSHEWHFGSWSFHFQPIKNEREAARYWKDQGIAGYNELDFSVGIGSPAETPEEDIQTSGVFMTIGGCAGFIPDDRDLPSDFRIPQNPSNAGVFVSEALSFGDHPTGKVRLAKPASLTLGQLTEELFVMKRQFSPSEDDLMALVVANFDADVPSISLCLVVDQNLSDVLKQSGFHEIPQRTYGSVLNTCVWGAKYILGDVPDMPANISISNFLKKSLTIENIISVEVVQPSDLLVNPVTWIFISAGLADASGNRLVIETKDDFLFETHKAFLARRLYTDSGRLVISQLHGGYSAQTYQVTSFDHQGRKLRPTVLKIANRAIIARESERCQKFALPYILNNSAQVLGTQFFGDTGALRYNFVGIGGGQSQLKWLTHYFNNWKLELLEPLFDKIFQQILHPWYGQPISETIYPFKDHDPTFTFFPQLCQTAKDELSVSSEDKYFTVEETGQQLINPYWFLKYEFARLRDTGIEYYTSICHGDLNMQNILLDEDMNVYLIDFSETKPRSLISDFARLEAIFMIEHAPLANEQEIGEYIRFISRFYDSVLPGIPPVNSYEGEHQDKVNRNVSLTLKMREYAFKGVNGHLNHVPYCLALLEWVLPVVCYYSAPLAVKRVSMIVAGHLCKNVMS